METWGSHCAGRRGGWHGRVLKWAEPGPVCRLVSAVSSAPSDSSAGRTDGRAGSGGKQD